MKSGLSLCTNPEQAALQSKKVMTSGDMSSMLSQAEYSQKMHEYDREQLKEYTNTVTERLKICRRHLKKSKESGSNGKRVRG